MLEILLKIDWNKRWPVLILLIALTVSNGYTLPQILGLDGLNAATVNMGQIIADQAQALANCGH